MKKLFLILFIASVSFQLSSQSFSVYGVMELAVSDSNLSTLAIGHGAGKALLSSSLQNTIIGENAASKTTGNANVAIGTSALIHNINGAGNVSIGLGSGQTNPNGSFNSSIGLLAGQEFCIFGPCNSAPARMSNFFGAFSHGDGGNLIENSTAIGTGTEVHASNQVRLGNSNVTSIGGPVGWSIISDRRFKKDLKDNVPGLEFINLLRPVTYHYDLKALEPSLYEDLPKGKSNDPVHRVYQEYRASMLKGHQEKSKIRYTGFIAQEVEEAAQAIGYEFSGVDAPKNENDHYSLRYSEFTVPLIKAVQELDQVNQERLEEIEALKAKNQELEQRLAKLEQLLNITEPAEQNDADKSTPPSGIRLDQNAPNPFHENTQIRFFIPESVRSASLVISGMDGRQLKSIDLPDRGEGSIKLSAHSLPKGLYVYTLIVNGKIVEAKKLQII